MSGGRPASAPGELPARREPTTSPGARGPKEPRILGWIRRRPRLYAAALRYLSPVHLGGMGPRALLEEVKRGGTVLNLGSGNIRHRGSTRGLRVLNVDLQAFAEVDLLADMAELPFAEGSADGVICEVALEHVVQPERVVREIERVLRPGGVAYVVVPFLQPLHAAPRDYHRWTLPGLKRLFRSFREISSGVRSGPTSTLVWTLSAWLGVLLSFGSERLGRFVSYAFQVLLSPLKFLDTVLGRLPGASGAACALYFYGRAPGENRIEGSPGGGAAGSGGSPGPACLLPGLFVLGVLVRLTVAGFLNTVSHNGAVFQLPCARALLAGDWTRGFSTSVPPLYAILTAVTGALLRAAGMEDSPSTIEIAGKLVSVLAGSLAIWPAYILARRVFDGEAARLAALFVAIQPLLVLYSGTAQEDMTYGTVFLLGMLACLRFSRRPRLRDGIWLGIAVGLAYHLRPDAMGLLAVALAGSLLSRGSLRGRLAAPGLAAGVFLLIAFPYILYVRTELGIWTVSPKGALMAGYGKREAPFDRLTGDGLMTLHERWLGTGEGLSGTSMINEWTREPAATARVTAGNLWIFLRYLPRDAGVLLFLLAVLRLPLGRPFRREEAWLLGTVIFYVLGYSLFYVSRRFWVALLPLVLVWSAQGGIGARSALRRRLGGAWAHAALAGVVLGVLPQTFWPVARDGWSWLRGPEREAGEWIAARSRPQDGVMSRKGKTAFYAGRPHVPLPDGPYPAFRRYVSSRGVRYLVEDEGMGRRGGALLESALERGDFRLVGQVTGLGRTIRIYEIRERTGGS